MLQRALVAVVVMTILALGSSAAQAEGLGGPIPDNFTHSFCLDFPLDTWRNNVVAYFLYQGYANVMAATDYDEAYDTTCRPETDVVFHLDTTMAEWAGWTDCRSLNTTGHCRSFVVYINPTNTTSPHDLVSLGCHEVGHTLGLDDGPVDGDDCMATGYTPSETLNRHHIDQVNAR